MRPNDPQPAAPESDLQLDGLLTSLTVISAFTELLPPIAAPPATIR